MSSAAPRYVEHVEPKFPEKSVVALLRDAEATDFGGHPAHVSGR